MTEIAVISVIQYLGSLLAFEVELLRGVRKEMVSIKAELEHIRSFLKVAESRAETGDEGVKIWMKQVRQVAYQIQDVIDEHILLVLPKQHGQFVSLHKAIQTITKLRQRHQIASQIQDIKTTIRAINEGAGRYGFSTSTSSKHCRTSTGSTSKDNMWRDTRLASLSRGDDEVVGIESSKYELISRLVDQNQSQRAVISVVGMGGIGKTTLAKIVFDNPKVVAHFNCKAWITVSQSYEPEELLKKMIEQLSGNKVLPLPDEGSDSLIAKLRGYLYEKRYIIVFDDVWERDFWGYIRLALPENSKGSRVIITTRSELVAAFCKETSVDHVHELVPLPKEKAWELFCKKAFQLDFGGHCPLELEKISHEIVKKCEGLPLAIVAIGGLLSTTKNKAISRWQKFYDSMGTEFESNPDLTSVRKILLFSYNDLPHHLKSCFLYFSIIPENYSIKCGRLIRLWIAEGFVKEEGGKTMEEAAEEYLNELIHRCLVLVSTTKSDGRVRECRVHEFLREIILSMLEESSFCQILEENSSFNGTTQRLSMHMPYCNMDKVMESIGKSPVHSVLLFQEGELPKKPLLGTLVANFKLPKKPLLGTLAANFKLLTLLDLEDAPLDQLDEEVGNLFRLRYLSIKRTNVKIIPKSIGKLQNLQTLNLKHSPVRELQFDISRLHKLRHLLAYSYNYESEYMVDIIVGVKIQGGIGGLEELQNLWYVETNHDDGLSLIKELGNLRQLRKLGIMKLEREHGRALCAAIGKMKFLQHLSISALSDDEILDLQYISYPPQFLHHLYLVGRLDKLPDWIPKLQYLVTLYLVGSSLTTNDPLKALQVLPSLVGLGLRDAYDGEQLYFEVGSFQKLKQLDLEHLKGLNSVIIEEGALPLLEELRIGPSPQLKEVPSGIHHLQKLITLEFVGMPKEFIDRMQPNQGEDFWILGHIPHVSIWSWWGKSGYFKIGNLEEYFDKVANQRVTEVENET